jgi:phosphoesterase RecJ-like protein
MFKNTNTKVTDTEEFINFVLSVKDVDIAIFFKEEDGGKTRVSFRSDIIDVSKLANNFGGGGHRCASAATVLGDIESVKEKVFDSIRKIQ